MVDDQTAIRFTEIKAEIAAFRTVLANPKVINAVKKAAKDRTLTLVLGAGASHALRLPQWDLLVEALYSDVYSAIGSEPAAPSIGELRARGYTNTVIIRHLEALAGFPTSVRVMLRDRLYATFDEGGAPKLIGPLCDLFLQDGAPAKLDHVITYNFDNGVERHLRRTGRRATVSIYSNTTYPLQSGGLRIYHPHGYLPHKEDDPDDLSCNECVVFSERDYNEHFMDSGHWSNVVQLHHFMNRTCLFVGASITDPNVRRLLDHARLKTGALVRHVSIQRTRGNALADMFVERDLHSLGVATLWVADYTDIPGVLAKCADI